MAVKKVKKDDTYESIALRVFGDVNYAGAVMRYFKGRPIYKGMKYNTAKLAGMPQGGQAYAALSPDINPWGLGVGIIPEDAWETEAGTDIAENYLAAIGMAGYGEGEAGLGITTEETGEGLPVEGFTSMEAYARQTGLYGDVDQPLTYDERTGRRPRRPRRPAETAVPPVGERPPAELAPQALMGDVEGERSAGAFPADAFPAEELDLGILGLGPVWEGLKTGLGSGFERIGEAFGTEPGEIEPVEGEGKEPTAHRTWQELYFGGLSGAREAATGQEGAGMHTRPSHYGARGVGMAALETMQMINQGEAPGSISPDVAAYLGYSDKLMDDAGYVKNSETGLWELDTSSMALDDIGEGTGEGGGSVGYGGGGYGRYRRRGRGRYGRSSYGRTLYNGQVNTNFNWRIKWD